MPTDEQGGDPVERQDPPGIGIDDLVDADFLEGEVATPFALGSEVHDVDELGRQATIDALLASYLLDVDEPPAEDP